MRDMQFVAGKMGYFKAMIGYTATFIRREKDPQKRIKLQVKRDLYIRGYNLCHEMMWGKGYRKQCSCIHFG